MAKETKVEAVEPFVPSEAEIKRSLEVLAYLKKKQEEEEATKKAAAEVEVGAAYLRDYEAIKGWIKKGHDNPGRLAAELKISVNRVEAILRKISREVQLEKEKEFLRIPGIPN